MDGWKVYDEAPCDSFRRAAPFAEHFMVLYNLTRGKYFKSKLKCSGKLSTIAEHSKGNVFLEVCVCWSQKVWIAGCNVREKGSGSQNITGPGAKMLRKKLQGQEGEGTFP